MSSLAIRPLGEDLGVNAADPSFDDEGKLVLWDGESVDWACKLRVAAFEGTSGTMRRQWKLPDYSEVEITPRRFVHSCAKFEKRSNWLGFGVIGVTVAVTADVVSAAKAAHRRKGKVAAGHVLYDWPVNVVQSGWSESFSSFSQMGITWCEGEAPLRLDVTVGIGGATQLAEYLVSLIARYRLQRPNGDIDAEGRELLAVQASQPVAEKVSGGLIYRLPGSVRAPQLLGAAT